MKRIMVILFAIGTALACQYAQTLAAVIFLMTFVCIIAVLYVQFFANIMKDEAEEEAERIAEERYQEMLDSTEYHVEFRQYVGLGKGYDK